MKVRPQKQAVLHTISVWSPVGPDMCGLKRRHRVAIGDGAPSLVGSLEHRPKLWTALPKDNCTLDADARVLLGHWGSLVACGGQQLLNRSNVSPLKPGSGILV